MGQTGNKGVTDKKVFAVKFFGSGKIRNKSPLLQDFFYIFLVLRRVGTVQIMGHTGDGGQLALESLVVGNDVDSKGKPETMVGCSSRSSEISLQHIFSPAASPERVPTILIRLQGPKTEIPL